VKEKNGKSFLESDIAQRLAVVEVFEKNKGLKDDKTFFYNATKSLTIRAYTTSKFYLTNVQVYEMVPSRWHGCVPLNKTA
jgi:hypothetical protein